MAFSFVGLKQAPEGGRCATGGGGDRGHMGDMGKGETGDTGLTGSTILRHDIKPKMDETVKSFQKVKKMF